MRGPDEARSSLPLPGEGPLAGRERLRGRVHLLGAGGAGVSGLARHLAGRAARVTGHDRAASELSEALRPLGVEVALGESRADHLPADVELVVRSAAVPDDDPQVVEAARRGVPVCKYAEALAALPAPGRALAVAGTHGKTTTAWMLWSALAGLETSHPGCQARSSALIGGLHRGLRANAVRGEEDGWFVVEACEYDRTFLHLAPRGAIVTNVEAEHLDCFGSLEGVEAAFADFARLVAEDGLLVVGEDVPDAVEEAAACTVWRLGRDVDLQLLGERQGCFELSVRAPGIESPPVQIALPGRHNADDAAMALALALGLPAAEARGVPAPLAAGGLAAGVGGFPGAGRRFEPWGQAGGVDVVHDYAHHPTEVRVTLEAARRFFGERPLHVLFQPHQHSRTARFLEDFAESLRRADRVVVADVYGARRHVRGERAAGAPELVTALHRRNVDALPGRDLARAVEVFARDLPAGAAALVLGAGDVDRVRDDLFAKLALRGAPLR